MRTEMHHHFRLDSDDIIQTHHFPRQKGAFRVTKPRKSAQPRKRRRSARKAEMEEGAFNTADLSDRLYFVVAELVVVSDAVAGSELQDPKVSGLRMILRRQIDEIRSLINIIHPRRTPPKSEEAAS